MRSIKYPLLCCVLLSLAGVAQLRAQDRIGCKDSPLITRFPGSTIGNCKNAEFDQDDFPLAGHKEKHVEGEFHFLSYTPKPDVVSAIQLFRNIETALKAAGFILDYEVSPSIITAHHGTTWFYLKEHIGHNGMVYMYDETLVTEKQMTQEVTANAAYALQRTDGNRAHHRPRHLLRHRKGRRETGIQHLAQGSRQGAATESRTQTLRSGAHGQRGNSNVERVAVKPTRGLRAESSHDAVQRGRRPATGSWRRALCACGIERFR